MFAISTTTLAVAGSAERFPVRRVYCVVDCGIAVNPDWVRAQMEGAIIFGLSAALDQEITLEGGDSAFLPGA